MLPELLLVAALPAEVLPFLIRLRGRSRLFPGLWRGRWHGVDVAILRCGVGPARAEDATRRALEGLRPTRVFSLGTAGSLTPELGIGDLSSAARILGSELVPGPLPGFAARPLASVDRVVSSSRRRAELVAQGAAFVEMEARGVAAAVASIEAARRPDLHVLKVISDSAGARPDPIFRIPWRSPTRALFEARALRLVESRLVPAMRGILHGIIAPERGASSS
jgi:nucleoside phosphorylase